MAAVLDKGDKELLRWYLTTLNLREIVESRLRKKSSSSASTESIDQHHQPQQPLDHQIPKLQQEPSEVLWSVVEHNGAKNIPKDDPRLPKSECVISIEEKLDQGHQDNVAGSWAKLSIYRIPRYLKNGENKAWVPQIVSLGPYHHGNEFLLDMERHKWRCLRRILERSHQGIGLYLDSVKKVEGRARACYAGTINMNMDKFVEMMVVDGCFVIELFRGVDEGFKELGYPDNDPVFSSWQSMHKIQQDMIMLENQIPLFILDQLLRLQLPDKKGSVTKLALQFFDPLMPTDDPEANLSVQFDPLSDQRKLHCLDVFRRGLLLSNPNQAGTKRGLQRRQQLIHCVTDLRKAGIKFRMRKTSRFWDIQFKDGTLEIPRLVIHDGTRSLFLNLIAFEQCHFKCGNNITSYVIFMDNLINSPEDVGYLHECEIIEHWLGSNDQVADLINRLSQEVAFDIKSSYLHQLSEKVNDRYINKCINWRARLKHNYFSNPWSIISVIAASLLLVLAFAQTFYGVYGYHRPRS